MARAVPRNDAWCRMETSAYKTRMALQFTLRAQPCRAKRGDAAAQLTGRIGNSNVKIEPPPPRGSKMCRPGLASDNCLAIDNPNPVEDSPDVGRALKRT